MKRFVILLVIAFAAVGAVSAQNWGGRGISQAVTVNGTLELRNGQIAVVDGNTVYFAPAIAQYVGFIEDLKEGARVSVNGFVSGNLLQPSRLTVNGKSYDFLANANGNGGYGAGWGCGGGYCYGNGVAGGYGTGRGMGMRGW